MPALPGEAGPELVAVSAGSAAPPSRLAAEAEDGDAEHPSRPGPVRWRFGAGAPVAAAPAVAADGSVYVATTEGKVHAIGPDGRFRWTHNVVGAVSGSPAVGDTGVVYAGNAQGYVHALLPSGESLWAYFARSPIVGDLVVGGGGQIHFATQQGRLVALSPKAGALWSANFGGALSSGPSLAPDGALVVGTTDGKLLRFARAQRKRRAELAGVVLQQVVGQDGTAYAIAGETAYAVGADGRIRWRVGPAEAVGLAPDGNAVLVVQRGVLVWWTRRGEPGRKVRIGVEPSAELVSDEQGCVYVPTGNGQLVVVQPDGVTFQVPVGRGPVNRPVLDPPREQVVAASGEGSVAAIATCAPVGHHSRG